ncbi:MAG: precorrin-3B C(17)-methyltransferase [Lachnospiraceae bacterium]|nr:precorrin-3B C(17)-methyltransferase [Lachnospiraceae bacterium]
MTELYIVGIGPGGGVGMTIEASKALENCEVIVGYSAYIDLIRSEFSHKELIPGTMKSEIERCRQCLELAAQGRKTALICSGDAGVYGMASPCLELAPEYPDVSIKVVSGVTAALSGAAVLGAPLGHDFCTISLSDLLTDRSIIDKRLEHAAQADLVIVLYNPGSRKRRDCLKRACELLLRHIEPERCCGVVRLIGREGESGFVTTLSELSSYEPDMFTTIFIGNSETKVMGGRMVTPRGYGNGKDNTAEG